MTIGESQMSGITLMTVLSITLTVLSAQWARQRRRGSRGGEYRIAAGLMLAGASALLAFHFVVQYAYQIRVTYGATTAAMVNLVYYLPAACLINLALLYLQRQGRVSRNEWRFGPVCYAVMLCVLGEHSCFSPTPR